MTALWIVLGVLAGFLLIWLAARWQDKRREDWHLPQKRGWPADGSPAIPPSHGELPFVIVCTRCGMISKPEKLLDSEVCPKCKLVM